MLHKFCHPVAVFCNMLDYVGSSLKTVEFFVLHMDVAWCCTRLVRFMQRCCTRACALGPLVARQGHINIHMFVENVARCCERLVRPLNHKSTWIYVTCSVTRVLPIHFCLRYSIFFARSFFLRYLFWFVDVCFFLCVTLFNLSVVWFFSSRLLFSFVLAQHSA